MKPGIKPSSPLYKMRLTEDQQRAVNAPSSVVVTAGAGTGKTAMLAERYLHHIRADGYGPLEMVAVTFTEKAADELRSRIRKAVSDKAGNEDHIAEVDAAQISTIHALCARICRDFYDVAGIPADFAVLDETNAELQLAEKFEEAVAGVEPEVAANLGYGWLCDALRQLLKDPVSSAEALEKTASDWERSIREERERAWAELRTCPEWQDARANIHNFKGAEGDHLETARQQAINAIADIESGREMATALSTLNRIQAHLGSNKNWSNGTKEIVQGYLKPLKQAVRNCYDRASLEFGERDIQASEAVGLLRRAFRCVNERLSEAKLGERVLDYADLEVYALRILKDPAVREHYAPRWRAFLVDEFQDTSPIQAEILELLTVKAKLTIVGDRKQAIYGFRNADVELFDRFREKILEGGGIEVQLDRSFRAGRPLVTRLNQVFEPVLGETHQQLDAHRSESGFQDSSIAAAIVDDTDEPGKEGQQIVEARYIAEQIRELVAKGCVIYDKHERRMRPVTYGDIAVLTRTWAPIDVYADVLAAAGIPAVNVGGGSLLGTREAKDGIAMLGFLADATDDLLLAAVLRAPFFAIDDRTLFEFAQTVQRDQSWWTAMQDSSGLSDAVRILNDLLCRRREMPAEKLLRTAGDRTGYAAVIANLPHGARREADWRGFLSLLRQLENLGYGDIFGATRYLRQLIAIEAEILRPPLEAGGSVSLMTIHRSKGLEWPVVFVTDLARPNYGSGYDKLVIDRRLGVAFNIEDEADKRNAPAMYKLIKKHVDEREEAEARRILYVAMTRAGDKVFVSAAKGRGTYIDLLKPGLESAGIDVRPIPFTAEAAVPPAPRDPEEFAAPKTLQIGSLRTGLRKIPVTAVSSYAECPRQFWYRFVCGHPGLGEGDGRAGLVGTLTHIALEHGLTRTEDLLRFDATAPMECVLEAIKLAENFRTSDVFARFREAKMQREERFVLNVAGVTMHGSTDIVGDDFVLDYKTGSAADPDKHVYQLSMYAVAFGKPKAYIAFLRDNVLHEFSPDELAQAEDKAGKLIKGIAHGKFDATPSQKKCERCSFAAICDSRYQ